MTKLNNTRLYPLAPSQIPEWYAYQLNPESAVYNISFNHFFFHAIDTDAFCQAWEFILQRHAIFRVQFTYQQGKPFQYLGPAPAISKETLFIDKMSLDEEHIIESTQNALAKYFALKPFDFINGPLYRLHLVRYPKHEFQLIFTVHHIIWDETSTMNLINEFVTVYNGLHLKRIPELPHLPISFLDYAKQENDAIDTGIYEKQKGYWLDVFSKPPAPLNLATDFPRPPIQSYQGDSCISWLPRDLVHSLNHFNYQNNTTLFIVFMSVLNLYIHRISGATDIVIGCPVAGRHRAEYQRLLGCFAVPIPLRCQLNKTFSFKELLSHITRRVSEAFDNYQYPCHQLIEELVHAPDCSRPKLFSMMAGVQNNKTDFIDIQLEKGSLYTKKIYSAEDHGARFDLAIGLDPIGGDIKFFCTYNTDLYKASTIQQMLDDVSHVMSQVIDNPELLLSNYDLVSAKSKKRLLASFSGQGTALLVNNRQTVIDFFNIQVRNNPHFIAIKQGAQRVRYDELNTKINHLSAHFSNLNFIKSRRVGVLLEPSIELIITLMACFKSGLCYVPIHIDSPQSRQIEVINQAEVDFVIGHSSDLQIDCPFLLFPNDDVESIKTLSKAEPSSLAYIMFTSGTTGKPKGVPILHQGLSDLIVATQTRYPLNETDSVLLLSDHTVDASILDIFWPLSAGAQIIIPDKRVVKQIKPLLNTLREEKITIFQTVPALLDALCNEQYVALDDLKLIICGAAAMTRALQEKVLNRFPCRLMNHYGPTEATVDALWFDCNEPYEGITLPLGRPLPHVSVYILDDERQLLPIGAIGNICIASSALSPGYLNNPELTQQRFFMKQLTEGSPLLRLYDTGDLGRFDENGLVYFLGRKDNQVKINGYRVELGEIEALALQHPAISNASVQYNERLIIYLELREHAINRFLINHQKYYQYTLSQQPWMRSLFDKVHLETWPAYFSGSPAIKSYWSELYTTFPEYQFCLITDQRDVACVANGIPLYWDGQESTMLSGWDEGIELAFIQKKNGIKPNTLLGLAGIVTPSFQGKNLSHALVDSFRYLAKQHGLKQFLGPVRPVGMFNHSVDDVNEWAMMQNEQEEPLDYWLRVHLRKGASFLGVASQSQRCEGSVAEWEQWLNVKLECSGVKQISDQLLQPLHVDLEKNYAYYNDPSIWVGHFNLLQIEGGASYHLDPAEFRCYFAKKLPTYMLPSDYELVPEIKLTTNGKIDIQSLPNSQESHVKTLIKPSTALEQKVLSLWESILKLDPATFGVTHDFFALGGQSLQLVAMLAEIEQQFEIKIKLFDFYHRPTILGLADLIEKESTPVC